ncbi:MAG: hypothetical protein HY267_00950 [Deltaproteobacteria bacterium]|nr:hypothetical protein [Deltaproteobacteria bacterium]
MRDAHQRTLLDQPAVAPERRGEAFAMMLPDLCVFGWQMLRPYRTVPISCGSI